MTLGAGHNPALVNKTNGVLRHRHDLEDYFGGNGVDFRTPTPPTFS
jgi:hypothetical protein